jgi:CRISPR system Cascade subunit CasA
MANGAIRWGAVTDLVRNLVRDEALDDGEWVVGLASPRPDFDGAIREFLIGLLAVVFKPANEQEWLNRWHEPPTLAEFQAALAVLPPAFDLDGDSARFFQDFSATDLADTEVTPIEQLLINAPGEQTVKQGKTLFVKNGRIERMGYPAAAMALIAAQTYAPSGGQGHRTSLRGGGPLTTLIDPRPRSKSDGSALEQSLFRQLWANVETTEQWERRTNRATADWTPADIFPWLAPTRTSGKALGAPTTPDDVHPLQAYFGLPRRIRLEMGGPGRCDVTGLEAEQTVVGFRMMNYGVQYLGWKHPFTPHYRTKPDTEWLPVHGQPGGVGWRDWVGLAMQSHEGGLRAPAQVVVSFSKRAKKTGAHARLHVFGYDMDNMKARGWTDAMLPLLQTDDEDHAALLRDTARRFTEATSITVSAVLSSIERALFQRAEDNKGDLSHAKTELWAATESAFYEALQRLSAASATYEDAEAESASFLPILASHATRIFDGWCGEVGTDPTAVRRMVFARFNLVMTLRGHSNLGQKLFAELAVPLPESARKRTTKDRTRTEATT